MKQLSTLTLTFYPLENIMKKIFDFEKMAITFTFNDASLEPVVIMATEKKFAPLAEQCLLHGIGAKVGDAAALPKGATEADKRLAILDMIAQLESGLWNKKPGSAGSYLLEAMTIYYAGKKDKTGNILNAEYLSKWLESKTDADKKALANTEAIAKLIIEIRAKKTGITNATDLLKELM